MSTPSFSADTFLSDLWKESGQDIGFCVDVTPAMNVPQAGYRPMVEEAEPTVSGDDDMGCDADTDARREQRDSAPMRYCPEDGHGWKNRSPYLRSRARRGRNPRKD